MHYEAETEQKRLKHIEEINKLEHDKLNQLRYQSELKKQLINSKNLSSEQEKKLNDINIELQRIYQINNSLRASNNNLINIEEFNKIQLEYDNLLKTLNEKDQEKSIQDQKINELLKHVEFLTKEKKETAEFVTIALKSKKLEIEEYERMLNELQFQNAEHEKEKAYILSEIQKTHQIIQSKEYDDNLKLDQLNDIRNRYQNLMIEHTNLQ
jgi:hypothetical protein